MSKTLVLANDMSNWNAPKNSRVRANDAHVSISIPKGGFASGGGVNLKFKPDGMRRATNVELSYDLKVDDDFDFVKGGKLGLGVNVNNGTGGKAWARNDGSFRLMWRRGGQVICYLYLCEDQGAYKPGDMHCALMKNQGKAFKDALGNVAPKAGLDVFRHTREKVFLKRGTWNTITMGATLNSKGKSDGSLFLELNGKRLTTTGICWTKDVEKNQFSQLQMPNWFGGGDSSWAPQKDECIKIRNVKYTTIDD